MKQDLRTLRRAVWPHREAIHVLTRQQTPLVDEDTRIYLRDCYDHIAQIMDLVEIYREMTADMTDLYLSTASHRMNEVMKVLTVISTIFMPLSFIAGLYGMNFIYMPELRHRWGYPLALAMMASVAAVMLLLFVRKGWIGPAARPVRTLLASTPAVALTPAAAGATEPSAESPGAEAASSGEAR